MSSRSPLPRALGLVLLVYLLAPFAFLLHAVYEMAIATPAQRQAYVFAGGVFRPLLISLVSAGITTAILLLLGVPLAYVLARGRGRWRDLAGLLVQLPLAVPPIVAGMLLILIYGPYAFVGSVLPVSDTLLGIVAAQTFIAAPFVVVGARAAFAAVDTNLEGVALTLGLTPVAALLRVALPAAWPGIRAALLLGFLRAFGEFGATLILAYHPYSLPVATYVAFSGAGLSPTLPLAALATAVAACVLAVASRTARGGRPRAESAAGIPEAPLPRPADLVRPTASRAMHLRLDGLVARQGEFTLRIEAQTSARRIAVLGPSGSGKSLTVRLLAGLHDPAAGSVEVAGAVWAGGGTASLPPRLRRVGYQPQEYALFPHLNVRQQVAFGLRDGSRQAREAAVDQWLERLQIGGLGHRFPGELSGGQRQRVSLARALVTSPHLLLLDEPFSALDTSVRRALRARLRALQDETGVPSVMVTHDPIEAAELAEEIWVLVDGRLAQRGDALTLRRRPASAAVAGLFGGGTVLEACVIDREWRCGPFPVGNGREAAHAALGAAAGARALRAQVYLSDEAPILLPANAAPPRGCVGAPAVVWLGHPASGGWATQVAVEGIERPIAVAAGPRPPLPLEPGAACTLCIDPADFHMLIADERPAIPVSKAAAAAG